MQARISFIVLMAIAIPGTRSLGQPALTTMPTTSAATTGGVQEVLAVLVANDPKTRERDLQAIAKKYPRDGAVLEAVGAGLLSFDQPILARPLLEAAVKLAGSTPPRGLLFNMGTCDLRQRTNAMRSVKAIGEYIAAVKTPADEPMQNLLGSLMVVAAQNKVQRKSALFESAITTYTTYDQQIEQAQASGGMKRWGAIWITAKQKKAIDLERKEAAEAIEFQATKLKQAQDANDAAERTLKRAKGTGMMGQNTSGVSVAYAKGEVNRTAGVVNDITAKMTVIRKGMPRPSWPVAYAPMLPPALLPDQPPSEPLASDPELAPVDATAAIAEASPAAIAEEPTAEPVPARPPRVTSPKPAATPARSAEETPSGNSIFDF